MGAPALAPCPGCGALFAPHDGPVHRYIGASAACWALYGAVLSGAVPDPAILAASRVPDAPAGPVPAADPGAATLLVDAYAAQHHGDDAPVAVQSVAVHLLVLHGVVQRGVAVDQALWIRRRALRRRGAFAVLQAPPLGAALTVRHLFPEGGVATPATVTEYVVSVHRAWEARHAERLRAWYDAEVLSD